jgi:hypothetical protein
MKARGAALDGEGRDRVMLLTFLVSLCRAGRAQSLPARTAQWLLGR